MSQPVGPSYEAAQAELTAAVGRAWDACEERYRSDDPIHVGANLPEMIREALEQFARSRHLPAAALVKHRPGSWEAAYILNLGTGADFDVSG